MVISCLSMNKCGCLVVGQIHPFVERYVSTVIDVQGYITRILDQMPEEVMMETSNS